VSVVPVSPELARYEDKRRLEAMARWRAAGNKGFPPSVASAGRRSLSLAEVDRQLVELGFGWVLEELDR
jgi:hypothetical protein